MSKTANTHWELVNVIWAIRERQKDYAPGTDAWNDCEVQASIRETRLEKMKQDYIKAGA